MSPGSRRRNTPLRAAVEFRSRTLLQMPLSAGSRIGHYEIVAPLGAGAMGEVYRARDSKLWREVAVVLPAHRAASRAPGRRGSDNGRSVDHRPVYPDYRQRIAFRDLQDRKEAA